VYHFSLSVAYSGNLCPLQAEGANALGAHWTYHGQSSPYRTREGLPTTPREVMLGGELPVIMLTVLFTSNRGC